MNLKKDSNNPIRLFLQVILDFFVVLVTGAVGPLVYVVGIALSVIGISLLTVLDEQLLWFVALFIALLGVAMIVLRIRKDVLEIKKAINKK